MLESSVGPREACAVSGDPWCVVFDADALAAPLLVRGRRAGDRMTPFGARRERRVKRLLIEARLPRWERARVPIVQAGPHIVWVGGVRRGAMAPVTAATRRVVQLTLSPLAEAPRARLECRTGAGRRAARPAYRIGFILTEHGVIEDPATR